MSIETTTQGLRIVASDDATVLDLEPIQGLWTETQYVRLTDGSRRLLEFTDAIIEVLPMPTGQHQVISRMLLFALFPFIQRLGGTTSSALLDGFTLPVDAVFDAQ